MMQDWTWQCNCGKWIEPYEMHGEIECSWVRTPAPVKAFHIVDKLFITGVVIVVGGVMLGLARWGGIF